jgi:hypothetical protein
LNIPDCNDELLLKNISSKNLHDDDINIDSMLITDEHIEELEDLIPPTRKPLTKK